MYSFLAGDLVCLGLMPATIRTIYNLKKGTQKTAPLGITIRSLISQVTVRDKGNMALSMPGANLIPVGLQLLVHDSPFRCYTDYTQFGHTPLVSIREIKVYLVMYLSRA